MLMTLVSTTNVHQQCWKEWIIWCAQEDVPNYVTSASKVAGFCLIHLGLDWLAYYWYLALCYFSPFGTSSPSRGLSLI